MAKPIPGSGIAPVRWINDTKEVEEIYFQSSDKAITGRMYIGTTWQSNTYGIDGTETIPRQGASISATVVERMNSSMVLLAFVADDGWVSVQTRQTANVTNYGAFTSPIKLIEGNGQQTKLTAVRSSNRPTIILTGPKIIAMSSDNATTLNWTSNEIP